MVTAFLNPEVNDEDINLTLPEGWPEGLKTPTMVVRLMKALYGIKQAPRLWHHDIDTFLLSFELKQSLADPNLYLSSDGILIHLYVNDISMLYPADGTKVAIDVNARLS